MYINCQTFKILFPLHICMADFTIRLILDMKNNDFAWMRFIYVGQKERTNSALLTSYYF